MKNLLALICLVFVFLTAGCDPINGPDPITPIVTVEGTYERVYAITNPDSDQPVQIGFTKQDSGAPVVNANQISENLYSFVSRQLYATYPNGVCIKCLLLTTKSKPLLSAKNLLSMGMSFRAGTRVMCCSV